MTKKEIVNRIAQETGLSALQTRDVVQRTFDEIIRALVTEGRIELRNFGVFEVRRTPPRRARNPRTGEPVSVPSRNVVSFQPGKEMTALVQGKGSDEGPREAAAAEASG